MQAVTILDSSHVESNEPPDRVVSWMSAVAVNRDRKAFEQLFAYFAPRLKSYMIRLGADHALAEDLAQETMVQVWRKAEQFDPSKAAPAAWVYRVARNMRIDKLRKRKFHEVELTGEADRADEGAQGNERTLDKIDANRLRGLIVELPAQQTEVVQLAFFEGLSHAEIGDRLSLPLGTVKSRLRLAFGKLRTAMGETT